MKAKVPFFLHWFIEWLSSLEIITFGDERTQICTLSTFTYHGVCHLAPYAEEKNKDFAKLLCKWRS